MSDEPERTYKQLALLMAAAIVVLLVLAYFDIISVALP